MEATKEKVATEVTKEKVVTEKKAAAKRVFAKVGGCDRLNLRKRADVSTDVITVMPAGTKVEIVSDQGDWCKVKADGFTGFCMSIYLVK